VGGWRGNLDTQFESVQPDAWLTFGLALVGGYGDAAGLVLARTFTGHITGNVVLTAVSMVARDWHGTLEHLLAIITFLVGVFLSVWVLNPRSARPAPSLSRVMGIEATLIVVACFALESTLALRLELFVACVSLALGMQNGAFRQSGGISVHTTYLTGMITSLITTKAGKLFGVTLQPAAGAKPRTALLGGIWIAFFLGAASGAAAIFRFRSFGMLGAALVLLALMVRTYFAGRREHLSD
jgi:uncharacterized membrane protein YoaK (UPF0700 family)